MPSFQVLSTRLPVRFLSSFPVSLPQPFHRCFPSFPLPLVRFCSGLSPRLPLPFVRFLLGSDYSASASSFPFSSCLRLSGASSVLVFRFRFLRFPRSLPPGFPCVPSRFRYSASCLFPFALPCFASHSRSAGASLSLSLSGFSASLPVPFVPFRSASGYSASVSSFPSSSRFRLTVASPVLRSRSRFFGLPRSSRPGFPCLLPRFFVLGFLFVSFHPSRFRSHSR